MFSVNEKTNQITLVRGDTLMVDVGVDTVGGNTYVPAAGDKIYFGLKKRYGDIDPLIVKEIPTDTMILTLDPADTKLLPFGSYIYDIEVQLATGYVDTIIQGAKFVLDKEVY